MSLYDREYMRAAGSEIIQTRRPGVTAECRRPATAPLRRGEQVGLLLAAFGVVALVLAVVLV